MSSDLSELTALVTLPIAVANVHRLSKENEMLAEFALAGLLIGLGVTLERINQGNSNG